LGFDAVSGFEVKEDFNQVLLDTVDHVLKMAFGEPTAKTIYHFLETHKGLRRELIPSHLEDFSSGLNMLFRSNAHLLEKLMIRHLCSKLQLEPDSKQNLKFVDYVQELKSRKTHEESKVETK